MKMLKALLLPLVIFGVVSCIDAAPRNTTPEIPRYQQVINSWTGRPVTEIIADWGPPDGVFRTGGKEYHVYKAGVIGKPGRSGSIICDWTFEIKNGIILGGIASGFGTSCKKAEKYDFFSRGI